MNDATQRLIDRYKETRDEVWLTQAALNCIHSDEPIPDGIIWYINDVLLKREKKVSIGLKKRDTINRNERYIREVRDLVFLTGVDPEDACHRVSKVNKPLHGHEEEAPAASYLLKLWNHRATRWKSDPALKVPYQWAIEWFGEYCKPDHGIEGTTLQIKRELFE